MEIVKDLWQVGGAGFTSEEDAAAYLIRFGSTAALVDAGCGNAHRKLVKNITDALPPGAGIAYLFLTHCHFDHTGGAAAVRDHFGCRIVAHALDAVYLEKGDSEVTAASWYNTRMPKLEPDEVFSQSPREFDLGGGSVVAHHCPGHTPGSVVYTATLHSRSILFGQDVHGPLDPSFLSNESDYRRSLEYLLDLKADVLCEGHFGVFRGRDDIDRFIRQYL